MAQSQQSPQQSVAPRAPATAPTSTQEAPTTDFGSNQAMGEGVAAAANPSAPAAPADPIGGGTQGMPEDKTLRELAEQIYGSGFYWTNLRDANPATVFDDGRVVLARATLNIPVVTPADPLPDAATAPAGGDRQPFLPQHYNTNHGHYVVYPTLFTPAALPTVAGEHHVHQNEYDALLATWRATDFNTAWDAGSSASGELGWIWTDPEEAGRALDRLATAAFGSMRSAVVSMGNDNFEDMKSHLSPADKLSWRWGKVVAALGRSTDAQANDQTALRRWFMPMPDDEILAISRLFEWRFDLTVAGRDGGNWNGPGLKRAWTVCEMLPPAQVANNPNLLLLVRDNAAAGSGYYDSGDHSSVIGHGEDLGETGGYGEVMVDDTYTVAAGDTLASIASTFGKTEDELRTMNHLRSSRVTVGQILKVGEHDAGVHSSVNLFNTVLRHEIGHAVDDTLNASDPGGYVSTAANAGQWNHYADGHAFVDAIVAAGGGLTMYRASSRTHYQAALYKAVDDHMDFNDALDALKTAGTVPASVPAWEERMGGPIRLLASIDRWASSQNPWYDNPDRAGAGGRTFVESYDGDFNSYVTAARRSFGVSSYQYRAPGEWFAEAYAAYYADHPDVTGRPTGTRLRQRDPAAATWFDTAVDAGYSLTSRAPGATAPAGGAPAGGTP